MTYTLSESDSKAILAPFGVTFLPEILVASPEEARSGVSTMSGPFAAKLCGDHVAHKSERGLVRLGLIDADAVASATVDLLAAARPEDEATGVLIAPMASGLREFIAGVSLDPVFGLTIAFGLGGVLAEALADVSIRLAPIAQSDAFDMFDSLRTSSLFDEFRGEPAIDRNALADVLMGLSNAAASIDGLVSIDLNPLMICDGVPIALDALVELEGRYEF